MKSTKDLSIHERSVIPSHKVVEKTYEEETAQESPLRLASRRVLEDVFHIPTGAFSGVAVCEEKKHIQQRDVHEAHSAPENGDCAHKRMLAHFDKIVAETFTNYRRIVDVINNADTNIPTTKDPREKYEGDIDVAIEQTRKDMHVFNEVTQEELAVLEKKYADGAISRETYDNARRTLMDAQKVYKYLLKELVLKKRGLMFSGYGETIGTELALSDYERANMQLEVKYLPGGGFAILRGYLHTSQWQENFGDTREDGYDLADIYADARYIAVEGFVNKKYGESMHYYLTDDTVTTGNDSYARLMKDLIASGFDGTFIEIDGRYSGGYLKSDFDVVRPSAQKRKQLLAYIKEYNPQLAQKIDRAGHFRRIANMQATAENDEREARFGSRVKDGTYYQVPAFVKKKKSFFGTRFDSVSEMTGLEYGSVAFADALSVIRILIMNEAMHRGVLERGIIVDFQGVGHLSRKSYFFDHPAYAMEVVLTNMHEILSHHPSSGDVRDIIHKLENLDEDTWLWVFDFIGTIPRANVTKNDAIHARGIERTELYNAYEHLGRKERATLHDVARFLASIQKHDNSQ